MNLFRVVALVVLLSAILSIVFCSETTYNRGRGGGDIISNGSGNHEMTKKLRRYKVTQRYIMYSLSVLSC